MIFYNPASAAAAAAFAPAAAAAVGWAASRTRGRMSDQDVIITRPGLIAAQQLAWLPPPAAAAAEGA
jgi:hypothetical protein